MRIDHIIYGTADLDAAEACFTSKAALTAVPGGAHDGIGTHNRIVPLGHGSFIELLAVADPDKPAAQQLERRSKPASLGETGFSAGRSRSET